MNPESKRGQKVEELGRYGMPLNDPPENLFKGQGLIVFRKFKERFGYFGLLPFAVRVLWERHKLVRRYPGEYRDLKQRVPKLVGEITMMVAMFNAIALREPREEAYAFVKSIFQGIAPNSLRAFYQLDDLVQCEGDVFDNFKKFNVAMFEAGDADYHVRKMEEAENHLRIVVDRCLNVEVGRMFDCPEIAMLGCDHDLAAYPHVDPLVNSEFRRPCTLAKGDKHCDFNFYRKGFAPTGAYVNK